jgi:DNA-binding HxlR family transcriptional regulator
MTEPEPEPEPEHKPEPEPEPEHKPEPEPEPEHKPEPEPEHKPEPETKHLLVLERMNRGAKNFEKIQKITGLERDELASILEDLEKRGLMKVEEKSGLFGPKVELYLTDKGDIHLQEFLRKVQKPKFIAREAEAKNWVYDLIKGDKQFVFVSEVPGPDHKIMVRLIDGILHVRGSGGFSKEVVIENSNEMQISDFKYRNGVLTLKIN